MIPAKEKMPLHSRYKSGFLRPHRGVQGDPGFGIQQHLRHYVLLSFISSSEGDGCCHISTHAITAAAYGFGIDTAREPSPPRWSVQLLWRNYWISGCRVVRYPVVEMDEEGISRKWSQSSTMMVVGDEGEAYWYPGDQTAGGASWRSSWKRKPVPHRDVGNASLLHIPTMQISRDRYSTVGQRCEGIT